MDFHFSDPSESAIKAVREVQEAIEQLRRDFVHFRTDDGGMRFVRIADVIDLHEWENESE